SLDAWRQLANSHPDETGSRYPCAHAGRHGHEVLRSLLGFEGRHRAHKQMFRTNPTLSAELSCIGNREPRSLKHPGIGTGSDHHERTLSKELPPEPFHSISLGHENPACRNQASQPLETDQQELQPPRLGRSNAVAMNGVDDDGYASQPSGPSAEDAGLGTVRVHDRRLETFQESRQLD